MRSDPKRWRRQNRLIAEAAVRLGLKVRELCDVHTEPFMVLEHDNLQILISNTRSPWLTQLAQLLTNHKYASRHLLRARGLPAIDQLLLENANTTQARNIAATALARYGRIVVKPNGGNRGSGIVAGIERAADLPAALSYASAHCPRGEVVIEPEWEGAHVRVSVVGGRFAAACRIEHIVLHGDGQRTVQALIEQRNFELQRADRSRCLVSNAAPYDGAGNCHGHDGIELSEQLKAFLVAHGLTLDSIPAVGTRVPLFHESEQEIVDVTDALAKPTQRIAELACAELGVDIGGVDFLLPQLELPIGPSNHGCLLEVNVLPALYLHTHPTRGQPRPVIETYVRYLVDRARRERDKSLGGVA